MTGAASVSPGATSLDGWRGFHGGAGFAVDPGARRTIDAAAETIDEIVRAGEPVYGVNTGFGKLADTEFRAPSSPICSAI